MAKIVFYEASETDKVQLTEGLKNTDHHWEFVPVPLTADTVDEEAEVVSVFVGRSHITSELMDKMPQLKLIATRSTGFDHVDLAAATERGVTVVNVPSYGENTVAEHVFTLLLALARKLPQTLETTKDGVYCPTDLSGFDLKGKTLGVVGMGRIGQHSARIGRGFGMEVVGFDVFEKPEIAEEIGFSYAPLEDVLKTADIVTLHAPLTPENVHLMNTERIGLMKDGAILINTARGELVDTRALIAALESGHLSGAGLDTIEGERFLSEEIEVNTVLDNKTTKEALINLAETETLLRMTQVVVTPHSAYNTFEAVGRINATTADNIIKFWYGETPNKVNK